MRQKQFVLWVERERQREREQIPKPISSKSCLRVTRFVYRHVCIVFVFCTTFFFFLLFEQLIARYCTWKESFLCCENALRDSITRGKHTGHFRKRMFLSRKPNRVGTLRRANTAKREIKENYRRSEQEKWKFTNSRRSRTCFRVPGTNYGDIYSLTYLYLSLLTFCFRDHVNHTNYRNSLRDTYSTPCNSANIQAISENSGNNIRQKDRAETFTILLIPHAVIRKTYKFFYYNSSRKSISIRNIFYIFHL